MIASPAETCDDQNILNNDGCSSSCVIENGYTCHGTPSVCRGVCGDGLKAFHEECDDGNLVKEDGCSHLCQVEKNSTSYKTNRTIDEAIETTEAA